MKDGTKTLLIFVGVAIAGVLVALYLRGQKAGSSGGIFSTIGSGWNAASSLTQDVTEKSVKTGETLGGGVKDAVHGTIGLVDDVLSVGGNLNPKNWF